MLGVVLPGIEKLAKELQTESFSILKAGQEGKVELTKRQIAQILANGFFCNLKYNGNVPHINFDMYTKKSLLIIQSQYNNMLCIYLTGYTVRSKVTIEGAKLRGKSSSVSSLTSKLSPQVSCETAYDCVGRSKVYILFRGARSDSFALPVFHTANGPRVNQLSW
jgi:hypothetical protein